jgi:two-component system chemotaxis response regulator CheY
MDRCKVLIVDENIHVRSLVKAILAGIPGAEVCECADGDSAIALAAHWAPDAALVDYETQPMSGAAFTEKVRAGNTSLPPDLPIVIMTELADEIRMACARKAGADAVLVKPLSAAAVVDSLQQMLRTPPMRQAAAG